MHVDRKEKTLIVCAVLHVQAFGISVTSLSTPPPLPGPLLLKNYGSAAANVAIISR